ncbi:hypothetical protein D8674_021165 [Pyrus ussuriensis x Pyrus communis]|uniref:Uncharacterized protein n=1 Tax=Pyrus ussuriensis x Pyrus communis TaxID=2448454 RepID=A0A5N5HL68_9ROSA|nr:hypothetical protein D8674_021165 [Pyrus ussuriensis x Pyrus communis]
MITTKENEKFISSDVYIDAMGDQFNQDHWLGLLDVNGKWVTVYYYKELIVGATH